MRLNITKKKEEEEIKQPEKEHKKQNLTFTHTPETKEITKLEATYKGLIG